MEGMQAGLLFTLLCVNILGVLSYKCPAGVDCVSQQICTGAPIPCAPGLYCPGDQVVSGDVCKRGEFCTTPSTAEECPVGHFCPTYTVEPLDCLPGSMCGGGNRKDLWYLMVLLAAICFAIAVAIWFYKSKTRVVLPEKAPSSISLKITNEPGKAPRMNISITNVGVTVSHKKRKRELLAGATGEFRSGKLVAIMGPSGAGKTTLLNVISGRIHHTTGNVFINGAKTDINNYDKLVGFVPQEDVMLRVLTVRQILDHSARVRLPASMSWAEKAKIVDDVIDVLGLGHVQHSQIGDEISRGISGGERKRVNIGIELVAKPSVLFLDEPTTGLDSSSAKDVVTCLHDIAHSGITVVAVLHQPRYDILSLCDDLLLLGKGGKTAYMGPTAEALPYFRNVGYECPPHLNPADFFIDITSGRLPIDPNCPPAYLPPPVITAPVPDVDRLRRGPARSRSNSSEGRRGRSISGIDPSTRSPGPTSSLSNSTTSLAEPPKSPVLGSSNGLVNSSSSLLEPPRGRSISGIDRSGAGSATLDPYRGRTASGIDRSPNPLLERGRAGSFNSDTGRDSPPLGVGEVGRLLASTRQRSDSHEFDPTELINHWDTRARAMSDAIEYNNSNGATVTSVDENLKSNTGPSVGFFTQFGLFFYRSLRQQTQDMRQFLTELVYQILPGLALGYATNFEFYTPPIPGMLVGLCPAVVRGKCETDPVGRQVEQIIFYMTMVASAAAAATATSRFGQEKANFKRERKAGINIYAYFLAKNLYDIIDVIRCVLLFIGTFFFLGGATGYFRDWFSVMFMMMFAAYGMGYFLSIIASYNKALVASVVCCIMWSVTSGLSPTLKQVKDYSVLQIFWWLSYARWGGEGLNLTLATDFPHLKDRIDHSMRDSGYDPDGFALDMIMLLVIGILWRLAAFIGLYGTKRIRNRVVRLVKGPEKGKKTIEIKTI